MWDIEDHEGKQLETITLKALIEVIFPPNHFLWTLKSNLCFHSSQCYLVYTRDSEGRQAGTSEDSSAFSPSHGKGVWPPGLKQSQEKEEQSGYIKESKQFLILPKGRMLFSTRFRYARQPPGWQWMLMSVYALTEICPPGDVFLGLEASPFCELCLSLSANIQWKKVRVEPKAIMKHLQSWRLTSDNNLEILVFLASLPLSPALPHNLVWTDHSVHLGSWPKLAFITSTLRREISVMKPLILLLQHWSYF